MQMRMTLACGLVAGAMGFGSAGAMAQTYVGTWSTNAAQCRVDQSRQNAPLILSRNRYDQHEAHCTFASVRKTGPLSWQMRALCSVEGDRQAHTFSISVEGRTLTLRDQHGARRLVRCTR
jgi:hypothetical protein